MDLQAAENLYKNFKEAIFKDFSIGLVHGRLDSKNSEKVMKDFKSGRIDILVATSILEVGIDVPDATCMVVLDAERFGLSQIHQQEPANSDLCPSGACNLPLRCYPPWENDTFFCL